jgi:hypothetical protein
MTSIRGLTAAALFAAALPISGLAQSTFTFSSDMVYDQTVGTGFDDFSALTLGQSYPVSLDLTYGSPIQQFNTTGWGAYSVPVLSANLSIGPLSWSSGSGSAASVWVFSDYALGGDPGTLVDCLFFEGLLSSSYPGNNWALALYTDNLGTITSTALSEASSATFFQPGSGVNWMGYISMQWAINETVADWSNSGSLSVNDGAVVIPEPSTYGAGMALAAFAVLALRRRKAV